MSDSAKSASQEAVVESNYSTIYDSLVTSPGDITGMVAYALYKTAKKEWVMARRPDELERGKYHLTVTETNLKMFRSQAETLLVAYAESVTQDARDVFAEEAKESAIVKEVKRQNSFLRNAGASVVGSIVFAALLMLGAVLFFAPGFGTYLRKLSD